MRWPGTWARSWPGADRGQLGKHERREEHGEHSRGTGLLRDPRVVDRRRARRDQAGLPAVGARAASGRQPRRGGAGALHEVSAAYEVLSDPEKRRIVDLGGDPLGNGRARPAVRRRPVQRASALGDIMDAFFGGAARRWPRPRAAQPGAAGGRRADPDAADAGGVRQRDQPGAGRGHRGALLGRAPARVARPAHRRPCCDICNGRGEVQSVQRSFLGQVMTSGPARPAAASARSSRSVPAVWRRRPGPRPAQRRVRIPAGVADGMRVRLAGQGEVGPGGGPAGDLYVEVEEQPHELFTRDGADLHCTVRLPMTAAALGTTLPLPTLDGTEELRRRARHPGRAPCARCAARACRSCAPPAGSTARRPDGARRRRGADQAGPPSRPSCCASSPRCAARSSPTWPGQPQRARPVLPAARLLPLRAGSRLVSTLPLFLSTRFPAGDRTRLDGPEGRHAATVKRLRPVRPCCSATGAAGSPGRGGERRPGRSSCRSPHRRVVAPPTPRVRARAGAGQGRPRRARRRAGHRGGGRRAPAVEGRALRRPLGGRGTRRSRGGSAPRGRRPSRPAGRGCRWSRAPVIDGELADGRVAAADCALVLHEAATTRWPRSGRPPPARSCWWSGPRAGSPTTSWPCSPRRGRGRAARARGAARVHRRRGRPRRAGRADPALVLTGHWDPAGMPRNRPRHAAHPGDGRSRPSSIGLSSLRGR